MWQLTNCPCRNIILNNRYKSLSTSQMVLNANSMTLILAKFCRANVSPILGNDQQFEQS